MYLEKFDYKKLIFKVFALYGRETPQPGLKEKSRRRSIEDTVGSPLRLLSKLSKINFIITFNTAGFLFIDSKLPIGPVVAK